MDTHDNKPFSNLDDQLKILHKRGMYVGLDINGEIENKNKYDDNKSRLLYGNYYSIVNGYKLLFLKCKNCSSDEDEYLDGVTFDDIYNLYEFDRELRNLFLQYLLIFEEELKSVLAYKFAEKFNDPESYLKINSYDTTKNKTSDIYRNIGTLSGEIYKQCGTDKSKNAIKHYKEKYNEVPIWVIVNSLTIGNISYIYKYLDSSLQDAIAGVFSKRFKQSYANDININTRKDISPDALKDIIKIVNLFRNVCAHNEVLYWYSLNKPIKDLSGYFVNIQPNDFSKSNLFTLAIVLKLLLKKNFYTEFIQKLDSLFGDFLSDKLSNWEISIMKEMGFETDWKNILIPN